MAQQINVNLAFTADTARARSQLMELSQSLDSLLKGSAKSQELPITKELFEAQTAASSLKVALNEAVNVKTGKLDLLKFNDSLTKSGLTITELRHQLEALGPGGSAAFLSLSKSIMTAEVPIKRTSKMVNELWENLKKTAGWQISSSVIHGFMGSIQQAVGYAKDLNESLTDIRIVTGASIDEMAKFAEQANKSAKALSTTTTEYTKASLIYYQQGLSDAEVKERTDVTIKMANAAGSSAETVSQQMTAVWNNFDDGSKSLEYYADVMTALGAATASSTDEISAGLNKFASVASTVGLSYEYATAALATVTSTTRESADTVGTAFKTLFARIQGLQLGETLDDGTTLNKYSEALYKIGIDIKDTNGEMKDMNTILNEMGSKWQDLSKDQQLATAQTVAGVRQYTQLIALMDNWDFFEQNLAVAQGAEGTLQEQADIYAEGWEAARDRVRAATEDLFDSLLDSDFFIGFLNVIEDITSGVANLVDSFGGMPGAIALVGVAFTKVFNKQLVGMVDNLAYGFKSLTGANLKTAKDLREETSKAAIDVSAGDVSTQGGVQAQILQGQLSVQKMLIDGENQLGEAEKARVQQLLDINQMYADQALNAAKVADKNKEIVQDQAKQIRRKVTTGKEGQAPKITTKDFAEAQQKAVDLAKTSASVQQKISSLQKSIAAGDSSKKFTKQIKEITQELSVLDDKMGTTSKASQEFQKLLEILNTKGNGKGIKDFGKQLSGEGRDDKFDFITDLGDETNAVLKDIFKNIQDAYGENGAQVIDEFVVSLEKLGLAVVKSETALEGQEQHLNNIKTYIDGAKGAMTTFAESVVKGVQGASQMAMGLMSVKSAFEAIGNADMSFGDKLSSVLMSLAMGIPMVVNGFKMLKEAIGESGKKALLATAENIGLAASHGALAAGSATATTSIWAQAAAWLGLETAMAPVLLGLTLIVAAIAAVALIGWGLVAAFQAIKANSPEGKLAAAKEEAKALKGSLEDATTAANDLKSAFDGYDSVVAELDKCTRGTDEWAAALMNVNNSVLDLMSEYPELATMTKTVDGKVQKAVYKDEDTGALTIRDWAKENMQQQANAAVIANQGAYFEAQTKVREAQIIIDQKSIRDDLLQSVMGGPAIYNQEGAQADVNQITDLIMKNVDQFTDSGDVLDTLSNILKTAGFDAPEDALTSLAGTITESMGAFGDLNAAIAANVAAQQAQNDAIAASVLANKDYVKESKFQDEILSASGDTYETLLKEQKKSQKMINGVKKEFGNQVQNIMKKLKKFLKNMQMPQVLTYLKLL